MTTLLLHHDAFLNHQTPDGHPEAIARLQAVSKALEASCFEALNREEAPLAGAEKIGLAHTGNYYDALEEAQPDQEGDLVTIDGDTFLSSGSFEAASRAVGAVCRGIDAVMSGEADNSFCAVRPPGHHAEQKTAMGFCLFNSIAIGAHYAQKVYGLERVAVVDFDVHHGNGTQDIFWNDASLMFCSTHQMPLFPGSGALKEEGEYNTIVNAPLSSGNGGSHFKEAMSSRILPRLSAFSPDLVLISAGFDAHYQDPLGGLNLNEEDFQWATGKIMDVAGKACNNRVVSALEGGYNLEALASCAKVHVDTLMNG